jgi:hypothetical protein
MSVRVLISDKARELLEKEQERRIRAKWKRGYSLEQIASEAILWYASYGPDPDAFRDDNAIIKEEGF